MNLTPNNIKKTLLALFLLTSVLGFSQEFTPFRLRYQNNIKGDLTFIGNNIVNRDGGTSTTEPEDAYNATGNSSQYNNYLNMRYVDVDNDTSTFSSSSATLSYPSVDCNKIRYAALYWAATYPDDSATATPGTNRQNDFTQVKLKVPGGTYVDVVADELLYDGFTSADATVRRYSPYACYADVTAQLTALADPEGEYTIANVRAANGYLPNGGASGGWTLVIVYENPTFTGKLISTYDGFAQVNRNNSVVDIDYTGFETIPSGYVKANIGVAALEGDNRITGDQLRLKAASNPGFTTLSNGANPANNFFNSNISLNGVVTTDRNPNSVNTLGYDTDIFLLNNTLNGIIPNGETDATFRFTSSGDGYYPFFNSFNIEIIEPEIILEKKVENIAGDDITGLGVNLGQTLDYVLSFKNIGNDDATNYTIKDVLPINITLDELNLSLPTGVTYVYDEPSRTIIFTIPDNLVVKNHPVSTIRMRVKVAENCFDFVDACTNLIENIAYSTYEGVTNDNKITDDPSVSDFDDCGFVTPGATNFLLDDLSNCTYERTVQLCGENVLLDAGDNFDAYIWYKDENNNKIIDTGDVIITDNDTDNDPSTIAVTEVGSYIVEKQITDPCKGFNEVIEVVLFGTTQNNPIVDFFNNRNNDADNTNDIQGEIVVCSNDNDFLPKLFLCGSGDSELIEINIPDADSIVWEQLDEASCGTTGDDCANKNSNCTWSTVSIGNSFNANAPGKYRLVINYQNGCFSRFYFNVFQNNLDINYTNRDIFCATDGNITITNIGGGYGFRLVNTITNTIVQDYGINTTGNFDIATNGSYRVDITQLDTATGDPIVGACEFSTPDIGIRRRNFEVVLTATPENCYEKGKVQVDVNNVDPSYAYEIRYDDGTTHTYGEGTRINLVPTKNSNTHTFENLNPENYLVVTTTEDGCEDIQRITVTKFDDLELTAQTTANIGCADGEITVTAIGGFPNPDYSYAIWEKDGVQLYADVSSIDPAAFQVEPEFSFDATQAGTYRFIVVDGNNCYTFSSTPTVISVEPDAVYTSSIKDVSCFNGTDGAITHTITSLNGYQIAFDITNADGSITANNASGNFTNLIAGDYEVTVTITKGTSVCTFVEPHTVGGPIAGVTANVALTQDYTCSTAGIITVDAITGGVAPYQISDDGVNFTAATTTNTFTNIVNGTHTFYIQDANNCIVEVGEVIVNNLNPPTALSFSATAPNCPTQTADIDVTITNGNAPFTVEIIAPSTVVATSVTGAVATFNNLTPNTYTFRATDAKGCVIEDTFQLNAVPQIGVTGIQNDAISCFSATDGEATFSVTNISTSYSYTITGPMSFSGTGETATTVPIANLEKGDYTITVTDAATNCTATATVRIESPTAALTTNESTTQPSCSSDGVIAVTGTNGWGSYSYQLTAPDGTDIGTNTTGRFSSLTQVGDYIATTTDANGCSVQNTIELVEAIAPVVTITPNNTCYDGSVGLTLTANVTSGGDGNYNYSLNGGAFDTSNTFSGLAPGTQEISVRDGKDCIGTASITIAPELSVSASAPDISFCGTTTTATITAAGGTPVYVYALVATGVTPTTGDFNTTATKTISNIGTYDIYVRDNNGAAGYCEKIESITIGQDLQTTLNITNTPVACSGSAQSTITITATNGSAPFMYSIDGGTSYQPENTFNGISAGTFDIRVRDRKNCEVATSYSITEPFTLSASAAVTELVECNPSTGAEVRITNAQGGTAPYSYSFDGGANYQTSNISFLLPGDHTVFIKDSLGCTYGMDITVNDPISAPEFTTTVSYDCEGEGIITVVPSNTTNYDYTYELNGTLNSPDTNAQFIDVASGAHVVTVNYASNASPSPSVLLTENFGVGANTSITEIDPRYCYDAMNGIANTDPACAGFGTNIRLQDGEYSVTSAIASPYSTWLNPTDHTGLTNGRFLAINVGGTAGLGGIVYAKRGIEVLPNREITISLWAFNLLRMGTGGADPNIVIELVDASGTVIATTSTGNIPKNNSSSDWNNYTVNLDPGALTSIDIVVRTNSATANGNDIAIDDIQAFQTPKVCASSVTIPVQVEGGKAFTATLTGSTNNSCNAANDGTLSINVANFDASIGYIYAVNGGAFSAPETTGTIALTGLAAGLVSIEIQAADDASCSVTVDNTITEPSVVITTASITEEISCTNSGATITAVATGGTPNYTYRLEDAAAIDNRPYQPNATFTNINAGTYTVYARDKNGCEDAIDTALIVNNPAPIVLSITPTACYSGNNDGSIAVSVTSGNGNYQFKINGGAWITPSPTTATNYTFNNLSNGSYTIDVRDSFDCAAPQETITLHPNLNALINVTDISSCADGTISVTPSGGDANYVYAFMPSGVSPTATDFSASNTANFTTGNDGMYDVHVRDNNGGIDFCSYMETVTINPATPIIFTATPTQPLCYGDLGSIEVTISSGEVPYTIQIIDLDNAVANETNANQVGNTKIYPNLAYGNYTIIVSDVYGCSVTETPVTLNEPDELLASYIPVLPNDCSTNPADTGMQFSGYPTTGNVQFSLDGGTTWSTSDALLGYNSGSSVFPSIRTVDGSNNTICQKDYPRFIIPFPLDDLDIDINAIIVNCNELQVTVQGTEGVANYDYTYTDDPANFNPATDTKWTGQIPSAGGWVWNGLTPGRTYVFYVKDNNGCVRQSSVNVNTLAVPEIGITASYDPSCFGANTGEITYTITDTDDVYEPLMHWELYEVGNPTAIQTSTGNIPYTSPQTVTVSGLAPAEYYIVVTEVDGTTFTDTCISGSENLLLEELDAITGSLVVQNNISCANPGLIAIQNLRGGGGTYTFTVSGPVGFTTVSGISTNPISIPANSPAGNYSVSVTDQYGCTNPLGSVALTLTPNPTITNVVVDNCAVPFNINVTATSTSTTLLYSIDGGATFINNNGVFNNVAPGTYTVAVKDGNGCTTLASTSTELYPALAASAQITKVLDCVSNAEITIETLNGSGAYEVAITGPGSGNLAPTTMPISNTLIWNGADVAGTYTITVNDTNRPSCPSRTFTLDVATAVQPIATAIKTDISCNGANDGAIKMVATANGITPLTYTITPATGTYDATRFTFENLAPNTYTITATGTNGCTSDYTVTIAEQPAITNINAAVTEFGCVAGNSTTNASITIDAAAIIGGTATYVIYEFVNTNGTATTSDDIIVQSGTNTTYIETNTLGGSYQINIYDDAGCSGFTTATILPFDALTSASATITNAITCTPGIDGEVTINVTSTTGDASKWEYSDDNGVTYQPTNVFANLGVGTHNFVVRHTDTGCLIYTSATFTDPNTFDIVVTKLNDVTCYGTSSGAVTIALTDAVYNNGFDWEIVNTNGTATDVTDDIAVTNATELANGPTGAIALAAGSYYVRVSQLNAPGCEKIKAFNIAGPSSTLAASTTYTPITCMGNDGRISVASVIGGWVGYTYYISTTPNPDSTNPSTYQTNATATGLAAGNYEIWVMDAKGCALQLPDVVLVNPTPISASLQINQENCTNLQGEIEVVSVLGGQGSAYVYQLEKNGVAIGAPQNTRVFTGLGAGDYTVSITDQWSCTFTTTAITLYEEMTITTRVVKDIDCTLNPGGVIDVVVNGGSTTINYTATFPDGTTVISNTSGQFSGLTQAGIYTFEVEYTNAGFGVCQQTVTQELSATTPVTLGAHEVTAVSCNGLLDGEVKVALATASIGVNDQPVYSYNIYDATGTTLLLGPQTSPLFTGLAAGFYQVEAISARSCAARETIEITAPTVLQITATATDFACSSDNSISTSTVTVLVEDAISTPGISSGTAPYVYSIDGSSYTTNNTFTVNDTGSLQTITVYVKDGNSCPATTTVTIEPINTFTVAVQQDTAISCAVEETVTVQVTDTGNIPTTYSFEALPVGNPNATKTAVIGTNEVTFNLAAIGTYIFRVTDTNTGCYTDSAPYTIAPFDIISSVVTANKEETCFGAADGEATLSINGYTGGYNYEVFYGNGTTTGVSGSAHTSTNPFVIGGLSGGSYRIVISETDAPLCSETTNAFTIEAPTAALTALATPLTNVSCSNDQGELEVAAFGGYAPYSMTITNTTTGTLTTATNIVSTVFTGLSAGDYTVVVTDDKGCSSTITTQLIAPTPIAANISGPITLACYGDATGVVTATVTAGGIGQLQYQLNTYDPTGTMVIGTSALQTAPSFTGLAEGLYSITVRDDVNCNTETTQVTISNPVAIFGSLVTITPISCSTGATLELTANGGTAPYYFSTDGINFTPFNSGNTQQFYNYTAGNYQFYVQDDFNCISSISNEVVINAIVPLTVTTDARNAYVNCNGEATGIITAQATGGLGNYQYELVASSASSAVLQGPQNNGVFTDLAAGDYEIRVTSEDCTAISTLVTVTEPTPLVVTTRVNNVSCNGANDGDITVNLSGGSGGYQFAISPNLNRFEDKNTFTDLAPGTYTIIAQDVKGCFEKLDITITEPETIAIDATITNEICEGNMDGTISLVLSGGTAPYKTSVDGNNPTDYTTGQLFYDNLGSGDHIIFVLDANNCETNITVTIAGGENLNASVTPEYSCAGIVPDNTISVVLEDTSIANDVLYQLDDENSLDVRLQPDFTNIPAGDHTLIISHANGCINTIPFTIEAFEPLQIVLTQESLNEITTTVTGGNTAYEFYINDIPNGAETTYRIRETGTYVVTVIDSNGCEVSASIDMEFIDIEVPNFFTPDGDGFNDTWAPKNTEGYPNILTKIFDRYGREVYRIRANDPGWEGFYNTTELPTGDYWYIIILNSNVDDREFVGHFTLYR